jgi:hypothetical protein
VDSKNNDGSLFADVIAGAETGAKIGSCVTGIAGAIAGGLAGATVGGLHWLVVKPLANFKPLDTLAWFAKIIKT